ncbi:hypothetical protein KA005_67885 [bacterium]|nr:hypothetical protein [bacterium]
MSGPEYSIDKRIEKLELEFKELRRELRALRKRIDDLGKHHDKFGPIRMDSVFSIFGEMK